MDYRELGAVNLPIPMSWLYKRLEDFLDKAEREQNMLEVSTPHWTH